MTDFPKVSIHSYPVPETPFEQDTFLYPVTPLPDVLRDLYENENLPHEAIVVCNRQDKNLVEFVTTHPHINKHCLNIVNMREMRTPWYGVLAHRE